MHGHLISLVQAFAIRLDPNESVGSHHGRNHSRLTGHRHSHYGVIFFVQSNPYEIGPSFPGWTVSAEHGLKSGSEKRFGGVLAFEAAYERRDKLLQTHHRRNRMSGESHNGFRAHARQNHGLAGRNGNAVKQNLRIRVCLDGIRSHGLCSPWSFPRKSPPSRSKRELDPSAKQARRVYPEQCRSRQRWHEPLVSWKSVRTG